MSVAVETTSSPLPSSAAATAGLRRVDGVRIIVSHGHAVAEVTGVVRRYPRTFRVSLTSASRLAQAGVPVRIERR